MVASMHISFEIRLALMRLNSSQSPDLVLLKTGIRPDLAKRS
jgi:hypothetical protein